MIVKESIEVDYGFIAEETANVASGDECG